MLTVFRVQELVDDDVVDVDLVLRELLDETLGLVQRQELGDCVRSSGQGRFEEREAKTVRTHS